jgi:hypothetical protein
MTEAEWLVCTDPEPALNYLLGKVSNRKLVLYAVGGCRQLWHLLYDEASREAVEVAERRADGLATEEEIERADFAAEAVTFGFDFDPAEWKKYPPIRPSEERLRKLVELGLFAKEDLHLDEPPVNEEVMVNLSCAATLANNSLGHPDAEYWLFPMVRGVPWPGSWLLYCVFGNPFRPTTLNPGWLTWQGGTIRRLAQSIYEERAFGCLPLLADALEKAGCHDAALLDHCRTPGPHVRGCWVIDLLLGKE